MNNFEDVRRLPRALRAHLQNTESKNFKFSRKTWKFTTDFTYVFQKPQMKFFLKSMQKHRNSGVVACAGNLKFGMSLPLASFSITKKYQKFRRRARASRALSKLVKIMIFAQKWSKNTFFGSMC